MTSNSVVFGHELSSESLPGRLSDLIERGYSDQGWIDQLLQAEDVEAALNTPDLQGRQLLHSFLRVRWAGDKGSKLEAVGLLLDHGADVDAADSRGWTALHVAATESEVTEGELRLLTMKTKEIDAVNHSGDTPLYLLLKSSESVDEVSMVAFLEAGTDPFLVTTDHASPFQLLLEQSDKPKQHVGLVCQHAKEGFERKLNGSLQYALISCSAAAVEALLERCDHTEGSAGCQASHLLEAALSDRDYEKKVELLIGHGLPCDASNSSGMTLLHLGAAKGSLRILQLAGTGHSVNGNVRDALQNTPLHYLNVEEALEDAESVFDCVKLLESLDGDLNAINSSGESPLTKALSAGQKPVVQALVKAGASVPDVHMVELLKLCQVSVLAENDVIASSKQPLVMTLQVGGLMQLLAKESKLDEEDYISLGRGLEKSAIAIVDSDVLVVSELNEEVLFAAVENNQKQFVADKNVQEYLGRALLGGQFPPSRPKLRALLATFVCLLQLVILPFLILFYAIPRYGHKYNSFTKTFLLDKTPPSVRYSTSVMAYVVFILLLIIDSTRLNGSPVSVDADPIDYFVFFFVSGMALQELGQMRMRGIRVYFSSWRNGLDITVISLFLCHFIMRFVDWSNVWRPKSGNVQLGPFLRLATMLYGLASFVAILRFLAYLQLFPTMGPILVALKIIMKETASFLVIWALFLIAFSVAMTTVYGATVYGVSDIDCVVSLANTTDLQSLSARQWRWFRYRCAEMNYDTVVPAVVRGLFRTGVSLFWASFGLIETDDFRTATEVETVIGEALLCLWLLTGVIVLVNLLVAIVTNAFQSVQDHADVEWKFEKAKNLFDVIKSPIFVPPFNIFYYFAVLVAWALTFRSRRHEGALLVDDCSLEMETRSVDDDGDEGSSVLTFLEQLEEEEMESSQPTRGDLKRLEDKIDQMQRLLFGFSLPSVPCPHCNQPVSLNTQNTSPREEETETISSV